jgi:hypothetical protein
MVTDLFLPRLPEGLVLRAIGHPPRRLDNSCLTED